MIYIAILVAGLWVVVKVGGVALKIVKRAKEKLSHRESERSHQEYKKRMRGGKCIYPPKSIEL